MKQYLHTITRSLCIMVMLCGISNGAWADFSEGDGSQNSRWVITQDTWEEFASNYGSTTEYYFQLGEDIVLSEVSSTLDITSKYLDMNGYSITVGSDSYDLSFPDTFYPLFSSDLEDYVTYYFSIESDDELSSFINQHEALSKDKVHIMIMSGVTAPNDVEQITEFNGHFDGNSDDCSIIMPNCNINDLGTLFSEDIPEENVTNVKYAYNNLIITDAAGLEVLRENASEWDENDICFNYTIDLTGNDIVLGDDWTPIDNSSISIAYIYDKEDNKPTHYIIFPSLNAPVVKEGTNGYITSDMSSGIQECYQYSEITISNIEEVGYLNNELSSLCNACTNWRLTDNIDNTSEAVSSPIAIQGEFVSGEYAILMPGFKASYYPDNLPVIFKGVTGVKYNYSGINIGGDDDLAAFITNQGAMKELSTSVTIIENVYINADKWRHIDDDFDITFNNYIYATIDSQEGLENIAGDLSTLSNGGNYIYVEPNGKDKGENWYDYDMTSIDLGESFSTIDLKNELSSSVTILLKDNQSTNDKPFSYSTEEKYLNYFYTPSYELIDVLFNDAITDASKRTDVFYEYAFVSSNKMNCKIGDFAGHGTADSPYLIYNYEMLKKLVELIDGGLDTEGMFIELASDINAQGNERLTDIKGKKIIETPTQNIQFTNAFKGTFDGANHSIGGMTRPLFAELDDATIKNLGIVDCNMTGTALATNASGSTITMSYVSGVSNGLVSEDGNTVEDCYAYNPSLDESNRHTTSSTFNAETVEDISKTHNILKENCYELATNVYSDCTLFIPEDNTFYTYGPSNDMFKRESADNSSDNYINYINWENTPIWMENPLKSNVSLLHNVIYNDYWLNNSTKEWKTIGDRGSLKYLYSWHIVDKKKLTIPDTNMRVKNIYYSRGTGAYDGLNTIYLPFAWNPATDLYDENGNQITNAEVYILADKINDSGNFEENAGFKDYTNENSLQFFQPDNAAYAQVSNALPTILKVPSSGWYIKRSDIANYYEFHSESEDASEEASLDGTDSDNLLPNLYNNYWNSSGIKRSFMDIYGLIDDSGRAFHCGTFEGIAAGKFGAGTYNSNYSCFKLNSAGTGFAKVTATSTVQPFRTFFAINDGGKHATASAKALSLGFCEIADINDNPTSIDGVPVEGIHLMTAEESRVYSLDGRYVGQYGQKKLARGMYIMNGKKFVVK